MNKNKTAATLYMVQAAIIAALYVTVNYTQELILPTSSMGPVQFRVSELLCTLAVFLPPAIPGLTIGCLLSNIIAVGVLPLDMVLGTSATFLAAVCAYKLKDIRLFSVPFFALMMPVIFNAVIIGLELEIFYIEGAFTFGGFMLQASLVALGEFVVCVVLGTPFYLLLRKLPLAKFNTK